MDNLKRIGVHSENEYFIQKIRLCLLDTAVVTRAESGGNYDLIISDGTGVASDIHAERTVTASRNEPCDLHIPFGLNELKEIVTRVGDPSPLRLSRASRSVYIGGEEIKLTEVEFELLNILVAKKGGYASREELLQTVWRGEADAGVVTVYIHYLREKLERGGEKVILSSRKCGYGLSERFVSKEA